MNKNIILVEDDLNPLEDMLLSIQSILFVASKQKRKNAPQDNDTTIQILHILNENQQPDKDRFLKFKRVLETRQQDLSDENREGIPKLNYEYQVVKLDTSCYPSNCDECKNIVCDAIRKYCSSQEFAIMLDLVLVKEKDQIEIIQNETKILSQKIYEEFHNNCIPYTNYGDGEIEFRNKWSNTVTPSKEPFERYEIDGDVIFKPFRDNIYTMLNIGDIK